MATNQKVGGSSPLRRAIKIAGSPFGLPAIFISHRHDSEPRTRGKAARAKLAPEKYTIRNTAGASMGSESLPYPLNFAPETRTIQNAPTRIGRAIRESPLRRTCGRPMVAPHADRRERRSLRRRGLLISRHDTGDSPAVSCPADTTQATVPGVMACKPPPCKKHPHREKSRCGYFTVVFDQLLICVLLKANRLAQVISTMCATNTPAPTKEEQT